MALLNAKCSHLKCSKIYTSYFNLHIIYHLYFHTILWGVGPILRNGWFYLYIFLFGRFRLASFGSYCLCILLPTLNKFQVLNIKKNHNWQAYVYSALSVSNIGFLRLNAVGINAKPLICGKSGYPTRIHT